MFLPFDKTAAATCTLSAVAEAATGALSVAEEELPHVRGQGQKPGGPHARRVAAKRSYPMSKEWQLRGRKRAERTYSTFKLRRGDIVQGKEQQLHFAGAAVKRYPTCKVREIQVR